jgi:serine protease AprX
MNGTSMATGLASGVAALMLQANPALTPDGVKYRMLRAARPLVSPAAGLYNSFQQGQGRLWAPDAVLGTFEPGLANGGMDIDADLAYASRPTASSWPVAGPVQKLLSDDGAAYLYFVGDLAGSATGLGVSWRDGSWLNDEALASARMTWAGARMTWTGTLWAGNPTDLPADSTYATARMTWAGARMTWAGTSEANAAARMTWAGALPLEGTLASATRWVDEK